jgi:hypothetical protein
MKELRQKYFFNKRIFEITDSSLKCRISKPGSLVENEFSFEEISNRTARRKFVDIMVLVVCLIFVSIFISITCMTIGGNKDIDIGFVILFFILSAVFVTLTLSRYQNDINLYLNDGRYIAFYANHPTETEVSNFLTTLKTTQKEYLLKLYATDEVFISNETKAQRLYWLRGANIIDETEFDELKSKLIKPDYVPPIVGFNLKSNPE